VAISAPLNRHGCIGRGFFRVEDLICRSSDVKLPLQCIHGCIPPVIFVLAESHGSTEEAFFVTEEAQRLPQEAVSLFMSSMDLFARWFCLLIASKDLFDASGSHSPFESGGQSPAIVNLGRQAGSSAWAEATYSPPGDCTRSIESAPEPYCPNGSYNR